MPFNYYRASVLSAIRKGLHPARDELIEYLEKAEGPLPVEVQAYLKRQTKQPRGRPPNTTLGYRRFKRAMVSEFQYRMAVATKNVPASLVKLDMAVRYGFSERSLETWIAEEIQRSHSAANSE